MINGFEYFLNTLHYCLWLIDGHLGNYIEKIVNILLSPIPKLFFTKEYQKKCEERLAKSQNDYNRFFYDKKTGYHIGWAHHWFGFFYSAYPGFFSWILIGIADRIFGDLNEILFLLFFGIPIGTCYIPAYQAVFTDDKYLKYFKKFEKEDNLWHKKWKRITIFFCVGAILIEVIGFYCMTIIASI